MHHPTLPLHRLPISSLSPQHLRIHKLLRPLPPHKVFVREHKASRVGTEDLIHILQSPLAGLWIEAEDDGEVGIAEDAEHEVESPAQIVYAHFRELRYNESAHPVRCGRGCSASRSPAEGVDL